MIPVQIFGPHLGVLVRDVVPAWLVPVFVVVTELGNIAFLLVLFVVDYWFRDHRRGAHAIGLAIAGMALITALKYFFVVPRPPPEVNVIPISGYSFPSGHATTAAIGYGILAYDSRIGPRWARYGVASLLVVVVALSRVVLGVHYVRDVVAGVAVGVAFLAVAFYLTRHDPRRGFLVGLTVAVVGFVVSAGSHDGVAVLGAAIGAGLAWEILPPVPQLDEFLTRAGLLGGVLPVLLGFGYLGTLRSVPDPAVFLVNALLMVAILAVPHLAEPFD